MLEEQGAWAFFAGSAEGRGKTGLKHRADKGQSDFESAGGAVLVSLFLMFLVKPNWNIFA